MSLRVGVSSVPLILKSTGRSFHLRIYAALETAFLLVFSKHCSMNFWILSLEQASSEVFTSTFKVFLKKFLASEVRLFEGMPLAISTSTLKVMNAHKNF